MKNADITKICLLGDFSDEVLAHQAINQSFEIAKQKYGSRLTSQWIQTLDISKDVEAQFSEFDAVWCVPASPYHNMQGVLDVLSYVRVNKIPFLGTCGGYQHAFVEYAKNVLTITNAGHAEVNPETKSPIVTPLACALRETSQIISILKDTSLYEIVGIDQLEVPYNCSFGFNEEYLSDFESKDFRFSAFNQEGNVQAFELLEHPFFIGTSFQPERSALNGILHPIIEQFISVAMKQKTL